MNDDYGQIADEELLLQSVSEPRAFEAIVDRYQEPFLRKVRHILGNKVEVEDIVQETFTKIYLNAKRFKKQEGATFNSWGYKILINTTFSYYKRLKKKDGETAGLDDEIWALIPDVKAETRQSLELADVVSRVLLKMPEPLARVLALHFLDDIPQREIADLEGITVAAVKTRIHRAKKEFKKLVLDFSLYHANN